MSGHRPEHKALWMKFCHILAAIPSGVVIQTRFCEFGGLKLESWWC